MFVGDEEKGGKSYSKTSVCIKKKYMYKKKEEEKRAGRMSLDYKTQEANKTHPFHKDLPSVCLF